MCGSSPQILSKDLFEEAQHACSTLKHTHTLSVCCVGMPLATYMFYIGTFARRLS